MSNIAQSNKRLVFRINKDFLKNLYRNFRKPNKDMNKQFIYNNQA